MSAGGTLVTFEVAGGKPAAFAVMNALRLVAMSATTWATASRSITHPATTTHMRIGAEERARLGISDGALRLSVGLEDVLDLIKPICPRRVGRGHASEQRQPGQKQAAE